jgi:hypothetical protein
MQNIACPNFILNTIVAEELGSFPDILSKTDDFNQSLHEILKETIKNHKRFSLLVAPITRTYTMTLPDTPSEITLRPFERNKLVSPKNLEESFAYLKEWDKAYVGSKMSYEYHFWRHLFSDPSTLTMARRINEDVKAYKANGINGMIQDGSQRCFFPSGYVFYTYARTLLDPSLTEEDIRKDYFSAAYGENWEEFYSYLERLGELVDFNYFYGLDSENHKVSPYYSPKKAEDFALAKEHIKKVGRPLIEKHFNSDDRVKTVSVRLLMHHADFTEMLCDALIKKALAKDDEADRVLSDFRVEFGKRESELELFYDHSLAFKQYTFVFSTKSNAAPIINFD